jgi:restriction endonuclease S subunit
MRFDVCLANPPYSIKQWDRDAFASDPWGRNLYGTPPQGRADYAFWQHILVSLAPKTGRCAILFPHGVLFRQEEAEMRRKLIEADVIECVLGLGPNLFYNSPMEACVVICRTAKPKPRKGRILFVNAVNEVTRERARSFVADEHIERVVAAYGQFKDEPGFARVATLDEIRAKGGTLSIPLYVESATANGTLEVKETDSLAGMLSAWLKSRGKAAEALARVLPKSTPHKLEAQRLRGRDTCELFNGKAKWPCVRFGDVVENLNETERNPAGAGLERFVGLEHLEPGSLHIRAWGNVADGTTFTRRCRPGQVLFGKRRAYQRKVAVAEFDAVVSGDIYVLAPKNDRLLPELLPFLCLSERFFQHAVGTSAGSLSPRTNWSSLASFELDLPPLDQQRRIAAVLWGVDETVEKYLNTARHCDQWRMAFVDECCLYERFPRVKLEQVIDSIVAGKSVVGVNETVSDGQFGVLKISAVGPNGFDPLEHKRLIRSKDFVPRFAVTAGDFLITRCNTTELVGRVCIVTESHPSLMLCDKTIKLVFTGDKVKAGYMEAILKSRDLRIQIEARATGTGGAMKNISQDDIRSLVVPLPSITKQMGLLQQLQRVEAAKLSLEAAAQSAVKFQAGITNSVVS